MNKKIKSLITTVSLLSIMTIQAEALHKVPPNVELLGNAEGIVYVPGDEPFLLGEDMSPGDKVTRTLEIKNKYDKAYE
ncbi:MAG: LPXTG cell wall anchor domain-containing protein, partial [Peptostreptococcaceae bacterium]|nr:LPXTG cell wall anchor domain-containing protein [Peptostreptococcaceae bacterium]